MVEKKIVNLQRLRERLLPGAHDTVKRLTFFQFMETRIIECVPNFSEGRDPEKIKKITDAITAVKGVKLLDVDPGEATNRTVVTFVGAPEAVVEAAFQ